MKLCKQCKQMLKTGRVLFDKDCVCEIEEYHQAIGDFP